jgi:ABC-type dipeptide/oligopeptide/nickel transport system permease component
MNTISKHNDQNIIRPITLSAIRFLISLIMAVLLMIIILQLWKRLQVGGTSASGFNFITELSKFSSHAIHSLFLIFLALIVSCICAGTALYLSAKTTMMKNMGTGIKILFYILSSIPCIFAGYFFNWMAVHYFSISLSYNPLTPVSKRWMYYIFPAIILGIGDGFLTELTLSSDEEINTIRRENYVKMAKLTGANMWKHIKYDFFIHISRTLFSRVAALLSGTVIVEFIFSLPGLGSLAFSAAEEQNTIRLIFVLLFSVVIVGFLNFLHRLIAVFCDPRLR